MRLVGWLFLALVGFAWVASEVPLSGDTPQPSYEVAWRRTAHGWEKPTAWHDKPAPHRPALHPMVVALLQVLLTLAALIAFSRSDTSAIRRKKMRRIAGFDRHARRNPLARRQA